MISFQGHLVIFLRSKRDCFGGLMTGCCDDKPWAWCRSDGSPRASAKILRGKTTSRERHAERLGYYITGSAASHQAANQALNGNAPHDQRQGGNERNQDGVGALVECQCHADIVGSRLPAAITHAGVRDSDAAVEPRAGEL